MDRIEKIDKNIPKIIERTETYLEILQVLSKPFEDFFNLLTLKQIISQADTAVETELELLAKSYGMPRYELESDAKLRAKIKQARLLYQEMGSKRYILDRLNEIVGVGNVYIRDFGDWGTWILGFSILGYDTVLDSGATQPFAVNVYVWYDETVIDNVTLTGKMDNYLKRIAPAGTEFTIICKGLQNWIFCPLFPSGGTNASFNSYGEGILKEIAGPVFVEADSEVVSTVTTVDMTAGIRVRVSETYSNLYYEISYNQGATWTEPKLVFEKDKVYYTRNPEVEIITGMDGIKKIKITFNKFNFDTGKWDKWEGYLKIYVFITDLIWLQQEFIGQPIYFDANTIKSVLDRDKIRYIMRTATKQGGAGGLGFGEYDFGEDFFGEGSGMGPDDPSPDGWTHWQQVWRESSLITSEASVFGVQFGIVIENMDIDKEKFWHRWFTVKKY